MLKTIAALGPEKALKPQEHYWCGKGRERYPRNRNVRVILDLAGIAEAMGVNKVRLKYLLRDTRRILRDFFNHDGRLFAS